jgi:hypothetical protein
VYYAFARIPHFHSQVVGSGKIMNMCSTTAKVSRPATKHKLVAAKPSAGCTETAIHKGTSTVTAAVTEIGISQFHERRVK